MFRRLVSRLLDEIYTRWKLVLSFRKSEWELIDYPVRIKEQTPEPPYLGSRFTTHRYYARILNWHVSGTGDTRKEAIQTLAENFEDRKSKLLSEGKSIPRPGVRVPIEFTSQDKVNEYPDLSDDFIHRVLLLEWAWISDESNLSHFHAAENNDEFIARINEIYGVDVSDIESAELWQIFERIESSRRRP